jgi:mono/diheme cytochrome c family protein
MKKIIAITCLLAFADVAVAQNTDAQSYSPEQIKMGSEIYAQTCAPCHGPRMADPEGAFDLRTFPHDQKSRFVNSVTNGKASMPPWGGLLKPDDIEALWAYALTVGKK